MTETALYSNDRVISLSPAADTTVLDYDFELAAESGLTVTRIRDGAEEILDEGVDFVFPGGLGDENGGSIQLVMPSQEDDIYVLIGLERIERVSDFIGGKAFSTQKINADLDKLTRVSQEARRDIDRAWKRGFGQSGGRIAPIEQGRFWVADAAGNMVQGPDPEDGRVLGWHDGKLTNRTVAELPQTALAGATGLALFGAETKTGAYEAIEIDADVTLTVGSGGDFATFNEGLAAASRYRLQVYKSGGVLVEVKLLSGFKPAEQIVVNGIDLGGIVVTAEDASVTIDRSALTTAFTDLDGADRYPFLTAIDGTLPTIACLFDMDTSGTGARRDGIFLGRGGFVTVLPECGVQNAGGEGIYGYYALGAHLKGAIFSEAGNGASSGNGRGVWFRWSGLVVADDAIADDCNWTAMQFQATPYSANRASGQRSKHYAFRARDGAKGPFRSYNGNDAAGHGLNMNEGATGHGEDATFLRCGETDGEPAVLVEGGSTLDWGGMQISGNRFSGIVECRNGTIAGPVGGVTDTDAAGAVQIRPTRGGVFRLENGVTIGMKTSVPINSPTASGAIWDSGNETGAATISDEAIDATHTLTRINQESGSLRTVSTINVPPQTPEGTVFYFKAADTDNPITLQPNTGNIRTHGANDIILDNADAGAVNVVAFIYDTSNGYLFEIGRND